MTEYRVEYSAEALEDLRSIYRYIALNCLRLRQPEDRRTVFRMQLMN